MPPVKSYFAGLTRSTFLLALASLFADVSSEMLYPVLPIFLTQTLGASPSLVGVIEGVAPAVQNLAQGFSGWLSDKLGRRKKIALAGYALAAVAKPLIGLATTWVGVLGARSLDRLGAGTRSAPRDALVAASVADEDRGKAFGLEGFGDNLGACLGPLLAIALLDSLRVPLRTMFLLAFIPGTMALGLTALVREKPARTTSKSKLSLDVKRLPSDYWKVLTPVAIFSAGNSSNSFLILRTKGLGASLTTTILIYAAFNLVAALASYPAGHLSDKLGRKRLLLLTFAVFFVAYGGFAICSNIAVIGVLFAFYGVHQGAFRSVGKALATDFVPDELRATSVGWYTTTVGLTNLIASVVGGQLWTRIGPPATFAFGAVCALLGSVALVVLVPRRAEAH